MNKTVMTVKNAHHNILYLQNTPQENTRHEKFTQGMWYKLGITIATKINLHSFA